MTNFHQLKCLAYIFELIGNIFQLINNYCILCVWYNKINMLIPTYQ